MSESKISYFRYQPSYLYNPAYSKLTVDSAHLGSVEFENGVQIPFDYHNSLDKRQLNSGILPPGLRLSIPGFLVFERPPTRKLVDYIDYSLGEMSEGVYNDDTEEYDYLSQEEINRRSFCYDIPIPWQIYMVSYSTNPASMYAVTYVRMFFSNTPLLDPNTRLYMPYINNFFTDGSMCNPMFDDYSEISRYPKNLEGVIAAAYDWVWNTGFNRDLYECVDQTISICYKNNRNSLIRELVDKKSLYSGMAHRFYKLLSNYSIDDVVDKEWANPSFTQHFQRDTDFLLNYSEKFKQKYFDFCGKVEPDSRYIDSSEHYFSVIGKPEDIQKTYLDIIEHMFYDSSAMKFAYVRYDQLLNNQIPQFKSFDSYITGLLQYSMQHTSDTSFS